ncbi:MAG: hypothetical protein U5K79_12710 [Cyclobacteriaceae bacterium]|nr:hypothetical protein [Cyclobacteriaceae bacterium]
MISNASQPLTKIQMTALSAQPLRKLEVEWKKNPEDYYVELSHLLMETLSTVF